MNSPIVVGLRVAAAIFGLMCLAQLLRVITQAEVIVADHHVPVWGSAVAVVIAGVLSFWLWKLSDRASRQG